MESRRTYRKQNRPVTACCECQRRKQKCDRERPCGQCAARNVGFRCAYSSDQGSGARPGTFADSKTADDELVDSSSLAGRVGYSSMSGQNQAIEAITSSTTTTEDATFSFQRLSLNSTTSKRRRLSPKLQSKYERCTACLPKISAIRSLLDSYYSEVDWYMSLLDRPYFEAHLQAWLQQAGKVEPQKDATLCQSGALDDFNTWGIPLEILYFPTVLFQVLAISLQFLPINALVRQTLNIRDQIASDRLSRLYSDFGVELLSLLGRHESTSAAVLADLLRCSWLKNTGRGNEAWFSLGDAVRQAQNLGLHLDSKCSGIDNPLEISQDMWYAEHRRRLWTSVFCWESHTALMLGRSRMINLSDCSIEAPLNVDFPTNPSNLATMLMPQIKPSMYTSKLAMFAVSKMIHKIMSGGALRSDFQDSNQIERLHQETLNILSYLPAAFRPSEPDMAWDVEEPALPKQRQHIILMVFSCLLALHRPHVPKWSSSRQKGVRAALTALAAGQRMFELLGEHQYRIHSLVFMTLDATLFLTSMARKYRDGDLAELEQDERFPFSETSHAFNHAQSQLSRANSTSAVASAAARVVRQCVFELETCSLAQADGRQQLPAYQVMLQKGEGEDPPAFPSDTSSEQPATFLQPQDQSPELSSPDPVKPYLDPITTVEQCRFVDPKSLANPTGIDIHGLDQLSTRDAPESSLDDLAFDVDLQTAVWMEQVGMSETSYDDIDPKEFGLGLETNMVY